MWPFLLMDRLAQEKLMPFKVVKNRMVLSSKLFMMSMNSKKQNRSLVALFFNSIMKKSQICFLLKKLVILDFDWDGMLSVNLWLKIWLRGSARVLKRCIKFGQLATKTVLLLVLKFMNTHLVLIRYLSWRLKI